MAEVADVEEVRLVEVCVYVCFKLFFLDVFILFFF